MSRITNSNPPKRGEKLTSTELNQVFTEANAAFPMDGDNVRNEGVDHPAFSLSGKTGQSGIILHKADDDTDTGSVIVPANEEPVDPFDPAITVHTWSTGIVLFNQDQVIRVYWQFENTVAGSVASPFFAGGNVLAWAVWLEWQLSSGGAFVPVPNQSDFEDIQVSPDRYGAATNETYGCTLLNHGYVYDSGSPLPNVDFPPARTGYGCWWYKADQNYTIYGLRLRCRGLMQNFYNSSPVNGNPINAWELLESPASTHQVTIGASNMAYMIMEEI